MEPDQAAGRTLTDNPWLTAETLPHAGGYRLQLAELSRELADSAIIKRLAATIPRCGRRWSIGPRP